MTPASTSEVTMSDDQPTCRADLFALAAKKRRKQQSLYTLSAANDPWMADAEIRSRHARWAAKIFERFDIRSRVHVRHVFYRLVSQEAPELLPDGEPFVNTIENWNTLCDAIRDARYLDLIQTDVIIDRRNPDPVLNLTDDEDVEAEISVFDGSIERKGFGPDYAPPVICLPSLRLTQEPRIAQPYHLEIWIEKSTMNDVLSAPCRTYSVNLATFIGEVSATACKALIDRAIASGKPVRIGYISDFDPAGRNMPVAAARKIDWFAKKSGHDLDIRLEPIALTEEQCLQYRLPRTPIKRTEVRAAGFEARYGSGATELDALEALHPGVLHRLVIDFFDRFYDHDLDDEVETAIDDYRERLRATSSEMREQFAGQISELDAQRERIAAAFNLVRDPAKAIYDDALREIWRLQDEARQAYETALEAAQAEIDEMEGQLVAAAEVLLAQSKAALEDNAPDPEMFDWPAPAEGDEDDDALYVSTRRYVEQVDAFREWRGDDDEVGLACDRIVAKTCNLCGKPFNGPNPKQVYCGKACASKASKKATGERRDGPLSQAVGHDGGHEP
jgi:hypothetical protein